MPSTCCSGPTRSSSRPSCGRPGEEPPQGICARPRLDPGRAGRAAWASRQAIIALESDKHDPSLDLAYRIAALFGEALRWRRSSRTSRLRGRAFRSGPRPCARPPRSPLAAGRNCGGGLPLLEAHGRSVDAAIDELEGVLAARGHPHGQRAGQDAGQQGALGVVVLVGGRVAGPAPECVGALPGQPRRPAAGAAAGRGSRSSGATAASSAAAASMRAMTPRADALADLQGRWIEVGQRRQSRASWRGESSAARSRGAARSSRLGLADGQARRPCRRPAPCARPALARGQATAPRPAAAVRRRWPSRRGPGRRSWSPESCLPAAD